MSPYDQARAALLAANAQRLAECDGPNKGDHPAASVLEFWIMPAGRLVILQRWTGKHSAGGFDYYRQGAEHRTVAAIADMLRKETP